MKIVICIFLISTIYYPLPLISQTKLPAWDHNIISKNFIKMLPNKGIIINNDSLFINVKSLNDIKNLFNRKSINYSLVYSDPQVGLVAINSPPPDYSGNWKPTKPSSFAIFLATLKVDSIKFTFIYSSFPKHIKYWDNSIKDSLRLNNIEIVRLPNAGINNDLKIGDQYEKIFKYFEKPKVDGLIRSDFKYNGVVFKLDLDTLHSVSYKKIKSIEINNLNGEL